MATTRPKMTSLKKPRSLTTSERLSELRTVMGLCFAVLEEDCDLKEIANLTGLSVTTLQRHRQGDSTLQMHVDTLQRICYAAGLDVNGDEFGYRISLLERRRYK